MYEYEIVSHKAEKVCYPQDWAAYPHAKTLSLIREPSLQIMVPPSDGE